MHPERNLLSNVRAGDKDIIGREMKRIMHNQKKRQGKGLTSSKNPGTINIQKPFIIWKQDWTFS